MYTAEIAFRLSRRLSQECVTNAITGYVVALQRNGQVINDDWPIAIRQGSVRVFVSIPERDALQQKHANKEVRAQRNALAEAGLSKPKCAILGQDPKSERACRCNQPSAYVLCTNFLTVESPLRCGDCFAPVPLYRIPHTSASETYEDIVFWCRLYRRCDELNTSCSVGERFAYRQMSRFDSELSTRGMACSQRIAEVTQAPCYYYLHRYSDRKTRSDETPKCPSCGRHWKLRSEWHGRFAFRCDRCQLVSPNACS